MKVSLFSRMLSALSVAGSVSFGVTREAKAAFTGSEAYAYVNPTVTGNDMTTTDPSLSLSSSAAYNSGSSAGYLGYLASVARTLNYRLDAHSWSQNAGGGLHSDVTDQTSYTLNVLGNTSGSTLPLTFNLEVGGTLTVCTTVPGGLSATYCGGSLGPTFNGNNFDAASVTASFSASSDKTASFSVSGNAELNPYQPARSSTSLFNGLQTITSGSYGQNKFSTTYNGIVAIPLNTASTAALDSTLTVGTQSSKGYAAEAGFSQKLVSVTVPSAFSGFHAGMSLQIAGSSIQIPVIVAGSGDTPLNPLVTPSNPNNPVYVFKNPMSGQWFDPPLVEGFDYSLTDGATFTSFTSYFGAGVGPLDVIVGGLTLGIVNPGDTFVFATPVSDFQLTGINPVSYTHLTLPTNREV